MKETIDLKDLMKAGIHFGHKPSVCHPRMKPFLFGLKSGVNVIDLEKSKQMLEATGKYVYELAARGGQILFVGTKPQARKIVEEHAKKVDCPYVTERWLGGTLTNFKEINGLVKKLERLVSNASKPDYEQKYTKKERLVFSQEMEKLEKDIGGISSMNRIPEAVFVTSVRYEKIAMKEAAKKGLKIIGVCDSNANPDDVDHIIPANDDAVKSIIFVTSYIADMVAKGKKEYEALQASNPATQAEADKK